MRQNLRIVLIAGAAMLALTAGSMALPSLADARGGGGFGGGHGGFGGFGGGHFSSGIAASHIGGGSFAGDHLGGSNVVGHLGAGNIIGSRLDGRGVAGHVGHWRGRGRFGSVPYDYGDGVDCDYAASATCCGSLEADAGLCTPSSIY